jgi:hypothetical protein
VSLLLRWPVTDEELALAADSVAKLAANPFYAELAKRSGSTDLADTLATGHEGRLRTLLKDHKISEDDERKSLDETQKITDQHIKTIDEIQKKKDAELLAR